jgi:hypothetical protein
VPSASLLAWRATRLIQLQEVDAQCGASLALVPPNPRLAEENVRGYGLLLSAHFQGFCRDLYTEAAQIISRRVRLSLRNLIQEQFTENCALNHGNPNLANLKKDFSRFGFKLDLSNADPANPLRLQHLSFLNEWRNVAAHHGRIPASGIPSILDLRTWRDACDGLARSLDGVMYNVLRARLRRAPWPP